MNTGFEITKTEVVECLHEFAYGEWGFIGDGGMFHVNRRANHFELVEYDESGVAETWQVDTWNDVIEFLSQYVWA